MDTLATSARPKRRRALLALTAAVLLGHALLLAQRGGAPATLVGQQAVQLRSVTLLPTSTAAPVRPIAVPPAAQRRASTSPSQPLASPAAAASAPLPLPLPEPPAPAADTALPVYATQLAPASTLHYTLRREGARGAVAGTAQLLWAPQDGHYTLALHGQLAAGLAWTSKGRIDAHGIAPERYSESRRGRELRAANFEREAGRIRFSGPAVEHPLPPGAQDRLSWLLQLGAVLAANPALQGAGSEVQLFVSGSRGDAAVWTFAVLGLEPLVLPGQAPQPALRVQRTAARTWDTSAEVWLDPSRHLLPLRALLTVPGSGHTTALELQVP